jgi:heat shock protein HslJ
MKSTCARLVVLVSAMLTWFGAIGTAHGQVAGWLDSPTPVSWNTPAAAIPSAPTVAGDVDARCRSAARPPQLAEDKQVIGRGWQLVGSYQGGWPVVVIRATAGYDGMCRPNQYQDFVFVRGVYAGTLSPQPMDSRTDGALAQVSFQGAKQLTVEYARYATSDALCCPSRTTTVTFDIATEDPVVRPVSASTSDTPPPAASTPPPPPPEPSVSTLPAALTGKWQLVKFEGGDGTVLQPADRSKYTLEFGADGRLDVRVDCNRGRGRWTSPGENQIAFRAVSMTRKKCSADSLHNQFSRQAGTIRSYVIRDGHLFLELMGDAGTYEFEPPRPRK